MKILFVTQSESLAVFEGLRQTLAARGKLDGAGFIVADSFVYADWLKETPSFESAGHALVKEWDVTARRSGKPDKEKLARYEKELGGEAGLFGAIIADRRLFMGKDCTYAQDYRRRFTDDELWRILQEGLEAVEKLFDTLKPELLVSFISVTFLDYLAYLFARKRGIRVLNLRPSRVGDRVAFNSILNDPTPEFMQVYQEILDGRVSPFAEEAQTYVQRVREKHGRYEGVVKPSDKPALAVNRDRRPLWKSVLHVAKNYLKYRLGPAAQDNHVADPLRMIAHSALINPLRAKAVNRMLERHYLKASDLGKERYVFFPLHTEPEVSLLVYGRPYVNQIEVIRMLAMSLPADMVLVIKEHPWMVGKRTLGAYRKLLNIPRVRIAHPSIDAREVIAKTDMVAVITGSVALEAAMLGKPVLTFGECPFNAFPPTMLRRCDDPRRLPAIIKELLAGYKNDDAAMCGYVAAIYETSASVNWYSVLLKKKGVYTERDTSFDKEVERLADYFETCLARPLPAGPAHPLAARW